MAGYSPGKSRAMAKALRDPERAKAMFRGMVEVADPTPISDILAIKENPRDPLNYLAAIPMLGNAAAFAKAIRRSNIDDLPADQKWRFDDDSTPDDMRQVFAEEFITDLELNDLQGQDLIDEVESLRKVDEDLYQAVGENLPSYMRNVDARTIESATRLEMEDARRIAEELQGASPEVVARAYKDLEVNDPMVLQLVQRILK
jgi:hypothetical protein